MSHAKDYLKCLRNQFFRVYLCKFYFFSKSSLIKIVGYYIVYKKDSIHFFNRTSRAPSTECMSKMTL